MNIIDVVFWALNVTFNKISALSWLSVLLAEETKYQEKIFNLPQLTK